MSADADDGQQQPDYDDVGATFRELREYSRGVLDVDHHDVHPVAGLIKDDRVRRVLIWMAENYSPSREAIDAGMPRDFWETAFAKRAIRTFASETATKAIENGNLTQAAYLTGLPSYKSDVSGLHAINQLADWLVHSEQCKLIYLAALMGRGKTDLSLTFLEVIHDHYRRLEKSIEDVEVPTPEFAANFYAEAPADVDAEIKEIRTERELLEWAEKGDSSQERWFIFDEASTELTAQSGANAQKVAETMAPFVKKMRKKGINMIVIGHDAGDVHVAIRSLADYVDKVGLKTASFYAGVNNREGQGHLFDLDGIPPTSWTFDTDDTAEWTWLADEAEGDDGVEIPDEYKNAPTEEEFKEEIKTRAARIWMATPEEVTQEDVAEAMSTEAYEFGYSVVSRKAKELRRLESSGGQAEAGA